MKKIPIVMSLALVLFSLNMLGSVHTAYGAQDVLAQGTTQGSATFVPLNSNLPGINGPDGFATSQSIPNLLNNIYKICIGLAAVLAVFQIMRAGILYMGGDSITEKKEAKSLIGMAVLGLVLVLAPTIIFTIINPDILTLKIGTDSLQTNLQGASSVSSTTPGGTQPAVTTFTTPEFLLAGRFTKTSNGSTCSVQLKPQYFSSLSQCQTRKQATLATYAGEAQTGLTVSSITFDQDCTPASNDSYVPATFTPAICPN